MEVGERLTVKDKRGVATGTVRYIGSLNTKPGSWIGIEWDDPARGANDGTFQGTRIFSCLRQPASASFINASKVRAGKTLAEAIHDRYTPRDDDLTSMSIDTAGYRRMEVTFKGLDKIATGLKALSHLVSVTVHQSQISRPV
jgi:tubulin-specific chaperone E